MSITAGVDSRGPDLDAENERQSLDVAAARNLSTTTKTVPQAQGITPRWLLRMLPWVQVGGGTYRVNRRLTLALSEDRLGCFNTGSQVEVIPAELGRLSLLRGLDDPAALQAIADGFTARAFSPGDVIVEAGTPAAGLVVVAHGKATRTQAGKYDEPVVLDVLADGAVVGESSLLEPREWEFTLTASTSGTALSLTGATFAAIRDRSPVLAQHLRGLTRRPNRARTKHGEADVAVASGHRGEPTLPATFVDYELEPREYELSLAQTVLRVHSRVADLYNHPMSQTEQQLRLTVEALRERQERELIVNREFGLLHNSDLRQRIPTRSGPPNPDDLDELLSRRRGSRFFLAHPRAIAAFGRECNRRGVYAAPTMVGDRVVHAWRGVPLLPCDKIPISRGTTSILCMRTGEENQGVIGLHKTGLPDEYQPGLNVRFAGIDAKAIVSYLVSVYFSAAVLVPDALGVLTDVEIGR